MNKINKISTKIKLLASLLIVLMLGVIATTIYLNQQNIKDALIVNIVGKQRMLTQQISKNIFYIYYSSYKDIYELNSATDEFISGMNILKHGDKDKEITSVPTNKIYAQLLEVDMLWNKFYNDIQNFKLLMNSDNSDDEINNIVTNVYINNTLLLNEVDKLVTMYTDYSETKTEYIRIFQYVSATIILIFFLYSLLKFRLIQSHIEGFLQHSRMLANDENGEKLKPIKLDSDSEVEIIEVSDTINCFIEKINSAMDCSNEALLQSQQASTKLEELTDEFDTILTELNDKSLLSKHLNNSEDIVIESTEDLLSSTKRLEKLKEELTKLTKTCQSAIS